MAIEEEPLQYIAAKHVRINRDSLYVISANGTLMKSPVIRVTTEIKIGYVAPLSMTGKYNTYKELYFDVIFDRYIIRQWRFS